jgi:Tfp pilus assembly ATPase PilU
MNLTDFDANLYRLYAVGLLGYEEALGQAQSLVRLRRAMLAFDQNARQPAGLSRSPSSGSRAGPNTG